jgi:hypothetical protein
MALNGARTHADTQVLVPARQDASLTPIGSLAAVSRLPFRLGLPLRSSPGISAPKRLDRVVAAAIGRFLHGARTLA